MNWFGKKDKLRIDTYHSDTIDIGLHPWQLQAKLKPMTRPSWFKKSAKYAEVPTDDDIAASSPLLRQATLLTGIGGLFNTIKTCPSFTNILSLGYVIHNVSDTVVTCSDDETLVIQSTINSPEVHVPSGPGVSKHIEPQFGGLYPFEKGFLKSSVKFVTQWSLRSNKDVMVMIQPCWWDENYKNVRAYHGLVKLPKNLDWKPHLNTMVRKPELGEEYFIPAGAPLAHVFFADLYHPEINHSQNLLGDEISKNFFAKFHGRSTVAPLSSKLKGIKDLFQIKRGDTNDK